MKLLTRKLTVVNFKSHNIEAQVATANTCQHLYKLRNSACPAMFVWGRLLNIYLTKNFHRARRTESVFLCQTLYETPHHPETMSSLTSSVAFLTSILRLMLCVKITIKAYSCKQ